MIITDFANSRTTTAIPIIWMRFWAGVWKMRDGQALPAGAHLLSSYNITSGGLHTIYGLLKSCFGIPSTWVTSLITTLSVRFMHHPPYLHPFATRIPTFGEFWTECSRTMIVKEKCSRVVFSTWTRWSGSLKIFCVRMMAPCSMCMQRSKCWSTSTRCKSHSRVTIVSSLVVSQLASAAKCTWNVIQPAWWCLLLTAKFGRSGVPHMCKDLTTKTLPPGNKRISWLRWRKTFASKWLPMFCNAYHQTVGIQIQSQTSRMPGNLASALTRSRYPVQKLPRLPQVRIHEFIKAGPTVRPTQTFRII